MRDQAKYKSARELPIFLIDFSKCVIKAAGSAVVSGWRHEKKIEAEVQQEKDVKKLQTYADMLQFLEKWEYRTSGKLVSRLLRILGTEGKILGGKVVVTGLLGALREMADKRECFETIGRFLQLTFIEIQISSLTLPLGKPSLVAHKRLSKRRYSKRGPQLNLTSKREVHLFPISLNESAGLHLNSTQSGLILVLLRLLRATPVTTAYSMNIPNSGLLLIWSTVRRNASVYLGQSRVDHTKTYWPTWSRNTGMPFATHRLTAPAPESF